MALQLERNVNLEEIDSDAPFGIEYLKYQSLAQKVIFWGCTIVAIGIFILTQAIYKLPFVLSFIFALVFGSIAVLFGANQNENLSIGQYLVLLFFKPIRYMKYTSTEDVSYIEKEIKKIEEEQLREAKIQNEASPEAQRRMLLMVVAMIVGVFIFLCIALGIKSYKDSHITHHTVSYQTQYYIET